MDPRYSRLLVALVLCPGCSDQASSCDLDTSATVLHVTISDTDDGVEAEIELLTPGTRGAGTTLELCPEGDRLVVNGVDAQEVRALGHLYYTVEFEEPAPVYEFSYLRNDGERVDVAIEMPPSFEIVEPELDSAHSRSAPLELAWTPDWPDHLIELDVSDEIGSSCIEGLGVELEVDDSGSYSIAGNTLVGGDESDNCEVQVGLKRTVEIAYPAEFHAGGSVTAVIRRRRAFTSVQ